MYGHRSRRIKTDQWDVAALTEACQRGCYRATHRRSAAQQTVQAQLKIRRELTDTRTRAISMTRTLTRGAGFRIRSGGADSFLDRAPAHGSDFGAAAGGIRSRTSIQVAS